MNLYVLGTGGLAREIALLALHVNRHKKRWENILFVASDKKIQNTSIMGLGVFGSDEELLKSDLQGEIAIGSGFPAVRRKMIADYLSHQNRFSFPNIIHHHNFLDPSFVKLGFGNIITAGCSFTCNIKLGNFNYINLNCTIGHDVEIDDYCVINPGVNISGGVKIHSSVLIGTGAQVLQNTSIFSDASVGAGAVVRSDVEKGTTVVGVPAKPLIKNP